jgi:hypothetical protein
MLLFWLASSDIHFKLSLRPRISHLRRPDLNQRLFGRRPKALRPFNSLRETSDATHRSRGAHIRCWRTHTSPARVIA